jgi:predicted ATPase
MLLARSTDNAARAVPLLADLLSIPTRGSDRKSVVTPERRREMTLETLEGLLESLSNRQPILVIFEDLHYADPTTRELLDRLVERAQNLPLMVIVTHRPTFSFSWLFEAHVTNLVLRRLDRADSGTLVTQVAHGRTLSADLRDRIVSNADGIPLFLEEVTKSVLEGSGDGQEPNAIDRAVAVPRSLQDPLLARIDRLGSANAVVRAAAVIGRRFSYELLAQVVPTQEEALSDALLKLMDAELVYARGIGTSATYRFKHGLVQEAIYATLLRADREALHARVVRAIEERFAETAEKKPELLAHHCTGARLKDEAVSYWQKAADQAIGRSALAEAAGHLTKALDTLGTLPAKAERAQQELSLQSKLGRVWILNKGYAAPEVEIAYSRAQELCEETGDHRQLFLVLLGLWQLCISRQHLERARHLGQQLLALAQGQNDVHFLLEAHVTRSITSHAEGAFSEALAAANRAIALYDPTQHRNHGARFGQDAGVISRIMAAWALWSLGYPDQALTRMCEAKTIALDLDQPYSQAMADYCSAWLHQYRGEPEMTRKEAERAINLSTEKGFGWPLAFACILHGWALAEEHRPKEGIAEMNNGLAALRTMGAALWQPHLLSLLGAAHASTDQTEDALRLFEEALDRLEKTGEREYAAEIYRLKGELLVRVEGQASGERAEACFRQAIEIAVEQQAKSWELRAATSLAELWCLLARMFHKPVQAATPTSVRGMSDGTSVPGEHFGSATVTKKRRHAPRSIGCDTLDKHAGMPWPAQGEHRSNQVA